MEAASLTAAADSDWWTTVPDSSPSFLLLCQLSKFDFTVVIFKIYNQNSSEFPQVVKIKLNLKSNLNKETVLSC